MKKNLPVNAEDFRDSGAIPGSGGVPLEKAISTHSSILARKIPWLERSLVGYSLRVCKESDMA